MRNYALAHVSDAALLRGLAALVARDRVTTASLLAHIAEVDARRLYVPAGYSSMHAYCVDELRLSEDAAKKRIQAARAARRFNILFGALAEGRLHLTGVWLLAPHLTPENAHELIEAATHRQKSAIEELLARRFPPPEGPAMVRAVTPLISGSSQHAPAHVESVATASMGPLDEGAPGHLDNASGEVPRSERFLVQVTISKSTHEKLRYAQGLLSHAVPTGDVAQVVDRALDALIGQLERRKFGVDTRRPRRPGLRPRPRTASRKRYIPTHVRRAVWERDQGQCTFLNAGGHRCNARRFLEFDHIDPVARGGKATVENMRLRCRAHNQFEAERAFGAGFMNQKRHEARLGAEQGRARDADDDHFQDVWTGLRNLGCRADEARRAAEFSRALHGATLEERMCAALRSLSRK